MIDILKTVLIKYENFTSLSFSEDIFIGCIIFTWWFYGFWCFKEVIPLSSCLHCCWWKVTMSKNYRAPHAHIASPFSVLYFLCNTYCHLTCYILFILLIVFPHTLELLMAKGGEFCFVSYYKVLAHSKH